MKLNKLNSNLLSINQVLLIPSLVNMIDNNEYVVKSGDTLYKIANNYNISVDDLKQFNNLNSNNLTVGQIIKIPNSDIQTYTVKSGDTLYKIANKFNTNRSDLIKKNNLSDTVLSIGQVLVI